MYSGSYLEVVEGFISGSFASLKKLRVESRYWTDYLIYVRLVTVWTEYFFPDRLL